MHDVVCCRTCGFVYVKKTLSEKEYAQHYAHASIYEFTRDEDIHARTFQFIRRYISKGFSIIDVGCSTGNLLGLFKKDGFRSLLGIDPSPRCKITAWKDFGVRVFSGTLNDFHIKKKYDLIILNNVLEHLFDVQASISKCEDILKPSGYLYIAVPDEDNFYKHVDEPFNEFSLEHINFFSLSSLKRLLVNFRVIKTASDKKVIYSLWRKHNLSPDAMKKYIELSKQKMTLLEKFIQNLPKEYVVWGAGSLARRLMVTTPLRPKYFVDRNFQLYSRRINSIPIISPTEARKKNYPVLIMSYRFKKEIKEQNRPYFKKIIELP